MHIRKQWREKEVVGKREIAIDTAACLNWRFFACWSELSYWFKTSQEHSRFSAEAYTIKFDENRNFRLSISLHSLIQFPFVMVENWECTYSLLQVTKLSDFAVGSFLKVSFLSLSSFHTWLSQQIFKHLSVFVQWFFFFDSWERRAQCALERFVKLL